MLLCYEDFITFFSHDIKKSEIFIMYICKQNFSNLKDKQVKRFPSQKFSEKKFFFWCNKTIEVEKLKIPLVMNG